MIHETFFYKFYYDFFYQKNFLPGFVCHHTDRASMMNSFEVRSPFLNKDLIEYANSLDKKYKYKNNKTKYILRKALERLGGSNELVNRKKMGFTMPLARWQKKYFADDLNNLPQTLSEVTNGFLNNSKIKRIIADHLSGKKNHYQLIHSLIIFSLHCNLLYFHDNTYINHYYLF